MTREDRSKLLRQRFGAIGGIPYPKMAPLPRRAYIKPIWAPDQANLSQQLWEEQNDKLGEEAQAQCSRASSWALPEGV